MSERRDEMPDTPREQLIGGRWQCAAGGDTREVVDPATEEVVATVPWGGAEDAEAAIEAARTAFASWSRATAYQRAAPLRGAADRIRERIDGLSTLLVRECGKPRGEARGELLVAADLFDWFAEEGKRVYGRTIPSSKPDRRMLVLEQPVGVVGVITAWNFPAYNPVRSWAAALAAGCTVVAKPAEQTPLTAMALAGLLVEAGLPDGVLNLVSGEPPAIGDAMLARPALRKISFTGSTAVGRILMDGASRTFTKLSLELGGNAPVLIFPDVDVDEVARHAARSRFRNTGQVCVAPQRFYVHDDVRDRFLEQVVERTRSLRVGSGLEGDTQVGPMISDAQRQRIAGMVETAREHGAEVLAGGGPPEGLDRGWFYAPTVLAGAPEDEPVVREENFGPVLSALEFDDVDDVIRRANDTEYGLAAYVFTRDLATAIRCHERLEFGIVGVNEWYPQGVEAPFGGWKSSGIGSQSGREGLHEFLETKLVSTGGID